MKFAKPFLCIRQPADQLIARSLQGNRADIEGYLETVSYYRLSGYWYPFRVRDVNGPGVLTEEFQPGTTIEMVWDRYVFDRRLRLPSDGCVGTDRGRCSIPVDTFLRGEVRTFGVLRPIQIYDRVCPSTMAC